MTPPTKTAPQRFIRRITVDGLFGQFNHDLSFGEGTPDHPNLLILYGENGTGKTTILWLTYHLLNKTGGQGHRSYVAHQQFKRIRVTFSDGLEISAQREGPVVGSFVLASSSETGPSLNFTYKIDEKGVIPSTVSDDPVHTEFAKQLPEFNFGFLPHDRSTRAKTEDRRLVEATLRAHLLESEPPSPIRVSIDGAIATARQQAIRASNQGQLTVNAIYTELIRQIAQVPLTPPETGVEEQRLLLLSRLRDQSQVTREYSKFGLMSELRVEGLLETLETMPASRFHIVDRVLEPFVRGNEARLEALNAIYIALTTTVETINSLYLNKRIELHLEKGLNIWTRAGSPLQPEQLSSGEQELLILFSQVISALRSNTILFIDEPELSLNVSWQRQLLESLLRCARGSNVQFVIATHSIEILAQYRANVTRLSNKIITTSGPSSPTEQTRG
jgi:ABC-type Mn2+/Zn2+ transport system ATPase subunit